MTHSQFLTVLISVLLFIGCKKTDNDMNADRAPHSGTSIKGIVAFIKKDALPNDTLSVSFSDLADTIYLTTKALPVNAPPVDVSRVVIQIEPDKGAAVAPSSEVTLDLRNVQEINVTAENGTVKIYKVKAIITPPYQVYPTYTTTVTELWSKTGSEMNLVFPESGKGMAVVGDHLVLLDNAIDKNASAAIRLYNKFTGEYVKNIQFYEGGWRDPRSYSWNLQVDDQDHLVMGRLNSGGAGFMLDYYAGIDAVPYILLNSTSGADLPDNTGKRFSVVGNLHAGKAFVYASAAHYFGAVKQTPQYAMWEFNNGVPVNTRPTVHTFAGATTGWYNAVVQRASVDDNTLYISWGNEDGYPNDPFDTWATLHRINFQVFKPGGAASTLSVNPENFGYRLLDSKVFKLKEGTFMAMLEQSYSTGGTMKLNLFNLTDPANYSKAPGSPAYESFRIFSSPESANTSNDGRYGHVTVSTITDQEAIVYVYYPNPNASLASVKAYKLTIAE